MAQSEARKRAAAKYNAEHRARWTLNAAKHKREIYQRAADAEGLSLNAWIIKTCDAAAQALQPPQNTHDKPEG